MVLEPIVLRGDWVEPLCAYMCMSSRISGQTGETMGPLTDPIVEPELSSIAFFPGKSCTHSAVATEKCPNVDTRLTSAGDSLVARADHELVTITEPSFGGFSKLDEASTSNGSFGPRPVPPHHVKRFEDNTGGMGCLDDS